MTAMDHMRFFSQIKGVPNDVIEDQSDRLLKCVNLDDVKDAQVVSFSGGMKRRLSVAIATIGDPKIIFFDEPTTGMDPVSRRNVWALMQEMKRDKTIILTTHAMEEADALADRIAVVVDGQLKCIGSPINLKNTFGDGYNISLICQPGDEKQVIELMDRVAPSNKLVDDAGGSLMFSVPLSATTEIAPLFKLIESNNNPNGDNEEEYKDLTSVGGFALLANNGSGADDDDKDRDGVSMTPDLEELRNIISDCGISHSTLEEVFMRVTGRKKGKHATK